jgi:DNA-binding CsgD family transcriptional regulator
LLERRAAAVAVELAHAAARGESIEKQLIVQVAALLEADVGAGLSERHPKTNAVAKFVSTHAPFSSAATQAASRLVARHPGFVAMAQLGTAAPVRLSDVTSLRWFWTTECYARTDGQAGARYSMGALLHVDSDAMVVVGLHRHERDFTDDEVAALALLQRPVAAALTFRRSLDESVAVARDGQPATRREPLSLPPGRTGSTPPSMALAVASQLCSGYRPTRREAEVLTLATQGWTNHQIGRLLGITERTVRKHLSAVYDKAGVRGRAAAAAWWHRSQSLS